MPILTVLHKNKTQQLSFEAPVPLRKLLEQLDIHTDHPCGGLGICHKCRIQINGRWELSCQYIAREDIRVEIPDTENILSESGTNDSNKLTKNICLCLDIGTTTIALSLVSLDDGRVIKTKTAPNPQREFGADVISRIDHCRRHGTSSLTGALHQKLKIMIGAMLGRYKLPAVAKMYVSGNTTMLHMFVGVDSSGLGVSPYTPRFLRRISLSGEKLGFYNIGQIILLPGISTFVGADIVADLYFTGEAATERYSLLVDLGTNAEIVLFNKDRYLCTAAAAGPCFEGTNISQGMSASNGAIYAYDGDSTFFVIGDKEPEGICATGLIDIIAALVRKNIVEENGYMEEDFSLSDQIRVTTGDIREFQLAKSAVMSAIECLLQEAGIQAEDVENLYVAGGFAAKLNIHNAVFLGLFPKVLANRFVPLNNASLLGTVKYACQGGDLSCIVDNARYIDLSANNLFSQRFFDNMAFGE